MGTASKKEVDFSKDKVRIVSSSKKAFLADPMEEQLEKQVLGLAAKQAQQKAASPAPSPKAVEAQASAQVAVAEATAGIKGKWPKAVDVFAIIFLAAMILVGQGYENLFQDNLFMKSALLFFVCGIVIFRHYWFEWMKQKIHIPDYMISPRLLIELLFVAYIIWQDIEWYTATIMLIILLLVMSFGPRYEHSFFEWLKKRRAEKGKIKKEAKTPEEKIAEITSGALSYDFFDALIGFIPFVGDIFTFFFINLKIPIKAFFAKLIDLQTLVFMLVINIIDLGIGAGADAIFPVIGSIADIFPSNKINSWILNNSYAKRKQEVALGRPKKGVGIALILIIIICSIAGLYFMSIQLQQFGGPFGEAMAAIAAAPQNIADWISHVYTTISSGIKKSVYMSTGDYYTGKVDENAKQQLGVYLEDMKQSDPMLYTDRPVIIYATLKVRTLDDPININVKCSSSKQVKEPQIFPKESFDVDLFEETDIDCQFPSEGLEKGSNKFTLAAEFNFKTMSYVKTYFMDSERIRSLRREEIDPLEQYGIKDSQPTAIYTTGPVRIGMGIGNPPVGIYMDEPQSTFTLGITLENAWEGKIIKMNSFTLITPKGFELLDIGAPSEKISCKDLNKNASENARNENIQECDDDVNEAYRVTDPGFVAVGTGDFKSYRAYLRVKREDYENIIGFSPVSPHYFKVTADYTYSLEKTKTIQVKDRRGSTLVETGDVDLGVPEIKDVVVETKSPTSAEVKWSTSEDTNDFFEWWEIPKPPGIVPFSTENEAGFSTSHSRTLTNLKKDKSYGYKITSVDTSENKAEKTSYFDFKG